MELLEKIYTIQGRLNRLRFWKYYVGWLLFSTLTGLILGFFLGFLTTDPKSLLVTVPTGIWSFMAGVGTIMINIRRLHDLDKSGWWLLVALVPFVNIIFLLYLWLAPGTVGRNRFGSDPLEN